ncbi:hypothetical protein SDC9_92573 [bioreactor metagenome]|uniref:Uncharacterized protein n=1 Tax=bioreactor metagenome TaxID=1076179 RepID=A0A645A0Y0_9ZZZZ
MFVQLVAALPLKRVFSRIIRFLGLEEVETNLTIGNHYVMNVTISRVRHVGIVNWIVKNVVGLFRKNTSLYIFQEN